MMHLDLARFGKVTSGARPSTYEGGAELGRTYVLSVDRPLDIFPPPGKIHAGYLRGLKSAIRTRGGNVREMLERHDVDPVAFDDPHQLLDCPAAIDLLQDCSLKLQDPLFGVHLADHQDPHIFGCVTTLACSAPTFGDALRCLAEYMTVSTSPDCELELVASKKIAELRWRADLCGCTPFEMQGLLVVLKTLTLLSGGEFDAISARSMAKLDDVALQALQRRTGCRVQPGADMNAVAFSPDQLYRAVPTANPMIFSLMSAYLAQLKVAARGGFVDRVKAHVRAALENEICTLTGCAEELGTSPRTLQKRLMQHGLKFADVVQDERVQRAKRALLTTARSLDEIAFDVGYAEQTSFGRAFKRATGMTPQRFRTENASTVLAALQRRARPAAHYMR